ncbi:DUF6264 family protein [Microbacterium cremeum]|uniref:DUF6264 family protein n=1 Tax=Microbacterium cremeum TaxID=2782169 RepID=UPI001E322721|nr:DUF6264 family protein [Microbacterium cremeum]
MPRASATAGRWAGGAARERRRARSGRPSARRRGAASPAAVRGVRDARGAARPHPPARRDVRAGDRTPVMPAAEPAPAPAGPAAGAPPRPRTVDRIVTVALLAYGLFNVLSSFTAFLDYGAYAETMFAVLGVDAELADPSAGRPWGIAAAVVLAVGWVATALVSSWSLRRGRLTWWIPLVAGIVFTFAAGIMMVVPLMNDPAVWDALVGSLR